MTYFNFVGITILLVTLYTSYRGMQSVTFFSDYCFQIDRIRIHKEYKRLFTSGFLHGDWPHLIFNMLTLLAFAEGLEMEMGILKLLLVYFGSLLGGGLLSLFINRHNGAYTAVGASGAVSGLVYASVALIPGVSLGLLFLPISIPGWLFGLLYTLYTIYGIRSKRDNIGHEAHLGGGLTGMALGLIMFPNALFKNIFPILLILIPSSIFLYLVFTRPDFLITGTIRRDLTRNYTQDDYYYTQKRLAEKELDQLLEKIHKSGLESLSEKERRNLERLSGKN